MIIFDQVTKEFGNGTKAISNVSFHIKPKEFVFITGPSGSGKTTLLRLLLREILPTSGGVFIDSKDISNMSKKEIPQLRRQIGAAFQDFKILPDWTVKENIGLGLEILDQNEAQIKKRVQHLIQLTGLKDKDNLFPSQLSGGELQRVVIARALAPEPKVLFADEPTGNLDQVTALNIIKLLQDINQLGTTVIMATHNQDIVSALGKRTIHLQDGKIVQDSAGKFKRPKHIGLKIDSTQKQKPSKIKKLKIKKTNK